MFNDDIHVAALFNVAIPLIFNIPIPTFPSEFNDNIFLVVMFIPPVKL